MSSPQPLPPKKEVALALLERSSVHLHLDPRSEGVVVPPWFKRQAQLVLQIGLNMPVPIPDLRLDDDGMSCTLSFNRSPFFCVVPWTSVFAMVGEDGRGMVWPDDVPPEVARQAQGRAAAAEPASAQAQGPTPITKDPSKRPQLEEVRAQAPTTTGTGKAKKSRKKPLAAAPDPESRAPVASSVPRGPTRVGPPVSSSPKPSPLHQPPSVGGARKKREIPPYLRVVK